MFDRYVNNKILSALCRPQYPEGCSVACLTTAINFLFAGDNGEKTQDEITESLGFHANAIEIEGGPGNEIVLNWFRSYVDTVGLRGSCGVLLDGQDARDDSLHDSIFEDVKRILQENDTLLVYHLERHYNVVCGFFEHANPKKNATQRWLILADPSPTRDPIWSVRWDAVLADFRADSKHCLLAFSCLDEENS
jgi:hypothetical protein